MYEKTYKKFVSSIYKYKYGKETINIINKLSTSLVYLIYPIALFFLGINKDIRFWKVLLIPGVSFVLLSFVRSYINFPRPYEVFDIIPIIDKDTKGKSFPSRHVFSVLVIAMTLYYIWPPLGIFLMFVGGIIAIIRVLGGVHFPRDVIAGAIIGILSGIIGWNLI